jgi:N-acetylmuramoyl-L-alanine amidase
MRWIWISVLCYLGWSAIRTEGAAAPLRTIRLHGQDYVDLKAWAEGKQFHAQWLKKGDEILLTNRWAKLVVKIDVRRVEINGIAAWLSYAVAVRDGTVYLARRDLQTLIEPVLFPVKSRSPARIKTVAIDPGHGGKDPGNLDGLSAEKRYTLLLATEIRQLLQRASLQVFLTRSTDRAVALEARPALARQARADLFISLHFNSAPGPKNSVKGVETYCLTPAGAGSTAGNGERDSHAYTGNRLDPKNVLLAYQLQRSIVAGLGVEDRGVRRARWAVLRSAEMPAVLIEGGFMTDASDAHRIYNPAARKLMAQAVVDGLLAYKRLVER